MKKFLAFNLSLVLLVMSLITPIYAAQNAALNPTDGFVQTVIDNITTISTATLCVGQSGTTVQATDGKSTGVAIVTTKDNLVIETNNENVAIVDRKVPINDAHGYMQGYAHFLTFTGVKAATTTTVVTCYEGNIAAGNIVKTSTISNAVENLKASYTATSTDAIFTIRVQEHTPVVVPTVAPTYAAIGISEYSYCSHCDKVLTPSAIIPKVDCPHEGNYVVSKVEPTCTSVGSITYYCPVEKITYVEYIPHLSHEVGTIYAEDTATCNAEGTIVYYCNKCHNKITEKTPAKRHAYTEFKIKNPTFTKDGSIAYKCEGCGVVYTETIDAYVASKIESISKTKTTMTINLVPSVDATKYVIKYSTSKNMKKAKTVTTTSTSKKITGLKSGTKYYVQIRTYCGDVYSDFTVVKSVKTK